MRSINHTPQRVCIGFILLEISPKLKKLKKENIMKNWKTYLLVGLTAGLTSLGAHAGAVDALRSFNENVNGLSGNFTQTVQSKKKTQTTSGSFKVLRPGLFKWEYVKPYKQTIVGDGKSVWLYDVRLKQVTQSDQNKAIGDSPAELLSHKTALENTYSLKEEPSKNGIDYVLATPKRSNTGYQFIRLGFQGTQLSSMELKDSLGNLTNIRFSNLNTKANLSKKEFQFTPPAGVDVLKNQ